MDTTTHTDPPTYATCSLHLLAEAVAPLAPGSGSTEAQKFLDGCRDEVLTAIDERTAPDGTGVDADAVMRDVSMSPVPVASSDVWAVWTQLRLWQDDTCATVLAACTKPDTLTDFARTALAVVLGRIANLLIKQAQS